MHARPTISDPERAQSAITGLRSSDTGPATGDDAVGALLGRLVNATVTDVVTAAALLADQP